MFFCWFLFCFCFFFALLVIDFLPRKIENFSSFSPKKDLVEVIGERKVLDVNRISTSFGVASGDLQITETT